MKPTQKQLSLEKIKEEVSVLNFLKALLFGTKTRERILLWVVAILMALIWLLFVARVFTWGLSWLGPVLLILLLFTYGLFRQAEKYRLPYYESLGIEGERWAVRRNLADLERIRDSLKAKSLYQREDIEAFIEQIAADLDLRYAGIWQHPLYLFVLGLFVYPVTQSTTGLNNGPSSMILVFSMIGLFLVLTVVPQLYDIFTERRRVLSYLLKCFVTISGDFKGRDHL